MSREWSRVLLSARCAYCGKVLSDGEPALFVTIDSVNENGGFYKVKRPFIYCAECKGPAPPGLPPAAPRQNRTSRMTPLRMSLPPMLSGRDRQTKD